MSTPRLCWLRKAAAFERSMMRAYRSFSSHRLWKCASGRVWLMIKEFETATLLLAWTGG